MMNSRSRPPFINNFLKRMTICKTQIFAFQYYILSKEDLHQVDFCVEQFHGVCFQRRSTSGSVRLGHQRVKACVSQKALESSIPRKWYKWILDTNVHFLLRYCFFQKNVQNDSLGTAAFIKIIRNTWVWTHLDHTLEVIFFLGYGHIDKFFDMTAKP